MKKQLSSSRIILLGFALVILAGTLLLALPCSTRDGQGAGLSDAFFTAVSATCVTGLVVQDTAAYWSIFGQAVILALIQIGGMGVITVAVALSLLSGRRIGLKERSIMQNAISAPYVGGIIRLTGFFIRLTLLLELLGAAALATVFCPELGPWKGLWYSLFHAVSAFCNAGFDLMGSAAAPFVSLTGCAYQPVVNLTVMVLIIIGGIGFLTWEDVKTNRLQLSKYRMQSKVILTATALLILLPAGYFFCFAFPDLPLNQRLWAAFFQSVTTRTAGFNTVPLTDMGQSCLALMIPLMLVGGSPGSTAGGMKTTTLAVILANALSVFRRKRAPSFFGRRVAEETVQTAATLFALYLVLFFAGGMILCHAEDLPLSVCLFETASAIGTVGLSLGITPELGPLSRGILILLMYLGRVGSLTLIFAAFSDQPNPPTKLPQEKLTIG